MLDAIFCQGHQLLHGETRFYCCINICASWLVNICLMDVMREGNKLQHMQLVLQCLTMGMAGFYWRGLRNRVRSKEARP